MIKKLNLLRTLMMLSFLTIFALSCKKDGSNDENRTEAQRIANAKEWYQKAKSKITLKSFRKVENVIQEISWTDAKLYKQADGNEIIGVPVDIKLNSGTKASGSYLLMISKTDEAYKHIIAYNAEKNHFTKEINDKDVKDLYSNTLKANANRKNSSGTNMSNGKVMVVEDDCTAWYLTETYYNEYGEIIQYYEHYLYTICEGLIDGGVGGIPTDPEEEEEFIPDFGYSVSVDEGGEAEETTLIGGAPGKVARRTWIFHDGYTYWGKSREKLVVKIIDGIRTWHSITHEEYYKVGGWALGNVEYLSVSVIPFLFEAESAGNATVEARYRVRLTPSVYNQNFDSEYKYSYATWNTSFQKTQ